MSKNIVVLSDGTAKDGGGTSARGLSDIALGWMVSHGQRHGLRLYRPLDLNPDATIEMTDSRAGPGRFYRRKVRTWDRSRSDRPVLHPSVIERTEYFAGTTTPYKPWIVDEDYEVGE